MQVVRSGTLAAGNPSVPGSTQTSSLRYFHHDQLGSIAAVTEGNTGTSMGSVIERLAYDPWGKRRNTNGLSDTTDSLVGRTTDRGFTEHEHLDEIGVVHMNGRIYDPLVGRFMSADPFIQAPSMLQSYNRYAYVMSNSLNLTDPSGYSWFSKLMHLGDRISSIGVSLGSPYLYHKSVNFLSGSGGYQLKSAALGYVSLFCGPAVAVCAGGFQGALARGYGASHDDALEAGVVAGITAAAFMAAGKVGNAYGVNSFGQYAAHAVAGCVTSAAGGGQCGQGAVSAVFGKFAGNNLGINGVGLQYDIANGITAVTAGGVGSVLGGGKFANGARTAAYGYLFNQLITTGQSSCAGNTCRQTAYEERYHYTGRVQVDWIAVNWDDPSLLKGAGDLKDLFGGLKNVPVDLFKIEYANQVGELKHEVRVDRQYFELTTDGGRILDQRMLRYEEGSRFKWVSDPSGRIPRERRQFLTCVGTMCANLKRD